MHIGKLVIVHFIVFLHPVISLIIPACLQFLQHIFQRKRLSEIRLILLMHPFPDIPVHDHVIGELLLGISRQPRCHISHHLDDSRLILPGIYRKNINKITAQRIHDGKLLHQLPVGSLGGLQNLFVPTGPDHQRQDDTQHQHHNQGHSHHNFGMDLHKIHKSQILRRINGIFRHQLIHHLIRHLGNAFIQYGQKLSVAALPDIHPEREVHIVHNGVMQGIREIVVHEKLRRISIDKGRLCLSVHDRLQRCLPCGIVEKFRIPRKPLLNGRIVLRIRNGHRSDIAVKVLPGNLCHPRRQIGIRTESPAGRPFRHGFKNFFVDHHVHAAAVRNPKISLPVLGHHQFVGQSRHVHHRREIFRHDAFQLPVFHIRIRFPVSDGRGRNGLAPRYHILDIGLLPFGKEG